MNDIAALVEHITAFRHAARQVSQALQHVGGAFGDDVEKPFLFHYALETQAQFAQSRFVSLVLPQAGDREIGKEPFHGRVVDRARVRHISGGEVHLVNRLLFLRADQSHAVLVLGCA